MRRLESIVVSALARVEAPAALWRKHRLGELSADEAAALVEEFEWSWYAEEEACVRFALTRLACFDPTLADAARAEGFTLLR